MKSGKELNRIAKKLFSACMVDGQLEYESVRKVVRTLIDKQPRGFKGILHAFWRFVRLENERNQALVESAVELDPSTRSEVIADLEKKYGSQIQIEFKINPVLIGGMKIRVGSDVWDGSVKNRLERLDEKFT